MDLGGVLREDALCAKTLAQLDVGELEQTGVGLGQLDEIAGRHDAVGAQRDARHSWGSGRGRVSGKNLVYE